MGELTALTAEGASAVVSSDGAELRSWRPAGGPELLWHGNPAHWPFWAPLLFPIVGTLKDDTYRWSGRTYRMFRHGFARFLPFARIIAGAHQATYALIDDAQTRAAYPFAFRLTVDYELSSASLDVGFAVENRGKEPMPYAVGFHPAFQWPFAGGAKEDYRVEFEKEEAAEVPELTAAGLVRRSLRPSPLDGRRLDLRPELFAGGAWVFVDANSREMTFVAKDGSAIVMMVEEFPHLVVWTKPMAPYISLEAWTSHSDLVDADGDFATKPGMRLLPPGETAHHSVRLAWRAAPG
ncbi:MAG: aldose 1-epimerase family protein [Alphaproteobacteria bacterium]|nr:aldose 1-epimerase family protein [Alphaproteobacteria bacterium]